MSVAASSTERIGPYEILEPLGRGGMAQVYKARHTGRKRIVALKVLHDHYAQDPQVAKRFVREAQVMRKLKHPYIVEVYEATRNYMAMEYMPHGSLGDRFKQPQNVSLEATAKILRQVATAVDHAHSLNIVHRDIKLENILLDEHRRARLTDFGIARVLAESRMTEDGMSLGTPHYMAPEQIGGQDDVDWRADIYSLSVVAYLLATGVFPFTAEIPVAILHQHMAVAPPTPTSINPELPDELDTVLAIGMAKNRDGRYQTAGALAGAFSRAVHDATSHVTMVDTRLMNPQLSVANQAALAAMPALNIPQPVHASDLPDIPQEKPTPPPTKPSLLAPTLLSVVLVFAMTFFSSISIVNGAIVLSNPLDPAQVLTGARRGASVLMADAGFAVGGLHSLLLRVAYVIGGMVLLIAGRRFYRAALIVAGFAVGLGLGAGLTADMSLNLSLAITLVSGTLFAVMFGFVFYTAIITLGGFMGLLMTEVVVGEIVAGYPVPLLLLIYGMGIIAGAGLTLFLALELTVFLTAALGALMLAVGLGLIGTETGLILMALAFVISVGVQFTLIRPRQGAALGVGGLVRRSG